MHQETRLYPFHSRGTFCAWLCLLLISLGAFGCTANAGPQDTPTPAVAPPSIALVITSVPASAAVASSPQPEATVSLTPTSVPRNVRVIYSASWRDFPALFARFSSHYPEETFALSAMENERQILAACGEGSVALTIDPPNGIRRLNVTNAPAQSSISFRG